MFKACKQDQVKMMVKRRLQNGGSDGGGEKLENDSNGVDRKSNRSIENVYMHDGNHLTDPPQNSSGFLETSRNSAASDLEEQTKKRLEMQRAALFETLARRRSPLSVRKASPVSWDSGYSPGGRPERRGMKTPTPITFCAYDNPHSDLKLTLNPKKDDSEDEDSDVGGDDDDDDGGDEVAYMEEYKDDDDDEAGCEEHEREDEGEGYERVIIDRLPGESLGVEVDVKRLVGSGRGIEGVFVSRVVEGGAVSGGNHKNVVEVGDEVVAINDKQLSSASHAEVVEVLRQLPLRVELLLRKKKKKKKKPDARNEAHLLHPGEQRQKEGFGKEKNKGGLEGKDTTTYNSPLSHPSNHHVSPNHSQISQNPLTFPDHQSIPVPYSPPPSSTKPSIPTPNHHPHPSHPSPSVHYDHLSTTGSAYAIQSYRPCILNEAYDVRRITVKKRREEELGIEVEPVEMQEMQYLQVSVWAYRVLRYTNF